LVGVRPIFVDITPTYFLVAGYIIWIRVANM